MANDADDSANTKRRSVLLALPSLFPAFKRIDGRGWRLPLPDPEQEWRKLVDETIALAPDIDGEAMRSRLADFLFTTPNHAGRRDVYLRSALALVLDICAARSGITPGVFADAAQAVDRAQKREQARVMREARAAKRKEEQDAKTEAVRLASEEYVAEYLKKTGTPPAKLTPGMLLHKVNKHLRLLGHPDLTMKRDAIRDRL